jgi:cytochrome P450
MAREEGMTTDFERVDYFTDASLVVDPHLYWDWLREQCPVRHDGRRNVAFVTGYDEAIDVMSDNEAYSRCNTVGGPFPDLPVVPGSDDITDLIEQYRDRFALSHHVITFDPPKHEAHRHLLARLLTPRRLQDREEFFFRFANRQMATFLEEGRCEFVKDFATPFATVAIADILGVPETDHPTFLEAFHTPIAGNIDGSEYQGGHVVPLEDRFAEYIEDRRHNPRHDTLTRIALATFPDGSMPELIDVVSLSTFLFAAGRGSTGHFLAAAIQFLAEDPDLQQRLRDDRSKVGNYVEEVLRLEASIKANYRLVRKTTDISGVEVKAGTTITLLLGGCNRDSRHFENPHCLNVDRPNAREHITFGRGIGACPGAPLARVEARVTVDRVLDRMAHIRISEEHHGPPGDRRYTYDPSYFIRRLSDLHIEFTPIG